MKVCRGGNLLASAIGGDVFGKIEGRRLVPRDSKDRHEIRTFAARA